MDGTYHFDQVHGLSVTEGGKNIIIYVKGKAEGLWGLRLPLPEIPTLIAKLFSVASEARKMSGDNTLRSLSIHEIKVIDSPKIGDRTILAVTFESGSPPFAMDLPKAGLLGFARSILQSAGELPSEPPSSIQ